MDLMLLYIRLSTVHLAQAAVNVPAVLPAVCLQCYLRCACSAAFSMPAILPSVCLQLCQLDMLTFNTRIQLEPEAIASFHNTRVHGKIRAPARRYVPA
jgi:hypothetical protein